MVAAARQPPPKILLTGFEPFDGSAVNPSLQAAQALRGRRIAGHQVVAAALPTVFGASLTALLALLEQHHPVLVLATGQAGGRPAICMERVAINVDDARIPDNAGAQPVDQPVVPGGPAAYFSTLPIKAMRAAVQAQGIPAEVSQTAGTFVCNHVFYGLMHLLAQPRWRGVRGGFVHVPWLPGQGDPSLPLEAIVTGLRAALAAALTHAQDIHEAAGALD
ncbi:pyroglutamyl-peptidase I [Ramlibacter sp.]|uniref:pyroglutamyl-peptidase I n=1 Tax=Ramlibacter sp. TaxID=1917967 RepID=UPI0035B3F299